MGLAVGVGMLAKYSGSDQEAADGMRADLAQINTALSQRGLEEHREPPSFDPDLEMRSSLTSFPYSWIHHLRRFGAHVMRDPKWVPYPIEPGEDPADDPVLRQMYRELKSHLLCHSDSEGYYLPLDFKDLILDPEHQIRGGVVGSSYRLRQELLLLVDPLEIEVDEEGNLSDEVAAAVAKQRPSGVPFAVERLVWLALYEASRLSIEHGTAIVFS